MESRLFIWVPRVLDGSQLKLRGEVHDLILLTDSKLGPTPNPKIMKYQKITNIPFVAVFSLKRDILINIILSANYLACISLINQFASIGSQYSRDLAEVTRTITIVKCNFYIQRLHLRP